MSKVVQHQDGTQSAEFHFDFFPETTEGKAIKPYVDPESGDIFIEGYAANFDKDRQEESFAPGAFDRGLQKFMERNPVLCYHHKFDHALGQIVQAEVDGKGLKVKARVDKPASGSWADDVYNKIKKGTIRAFSVGGIFRRKLTENGWRIHDMDFAEISVTPVPVNPSTTFSVVAGKAFPVEETVLSQDELLELHKDEIEQINNNLTELGEMVAKYRS